MLTQAYILEFCLFFHTLCVFLLVLFCIQVNKSIFKTVCTVLCIYNVTMNHLKNPSSKGIRCMKVFFHVQRTHFLKNSQEKRCIFIFLLICEKCCYVIGGNTLFPSLWPCLTCNLQQCFVILWFTLKLHNTWTPKPFFCKLTGFNSYRNKNLHHRLF